MFKTRALIIVALIAICISTGATNIASAQAPCVDINFIYAHGSGEKAQENNGYKAFKEQLEARFKSSQSTYNFYSLGERTYNGYKYPAIDVGNPLNGNALGAWLSGGKSFDYGNSVRSGILELVGYLNDLQANCPDTHIILAGYSQGAQVMGEAFKAIMPDIEKKIDFVALFGDPKLHLPEGYGLFAPACRGQNYSPWRRVVGNCFTSAGSLGARNDPYMPKQMESKTGLWCVGHDFICGSSRSIFDNSGHKHYADDNGSIDKAVREIASILKAKLPQKPTPPPDPGTPEPPNEPKPIIDLRPILDNPSADVMFVFDNSTAMAPLRYDDTIRQVITLVTEKVTEAGGRVGLISYCGCDFTSPIYYTPLQGKTRWHPIYEIVSGYEHDRTTGDLSRDLYETINKVITTEQWRAGAKRIIVPFTNSTYVPPIITPAMSSKSMSRTILTHESNPDTIIYPIVPPTIAASFDNLSAPGITVTPATSRSIQELSVVLAKQMNSQVVAELTTYDYKAKPGDTLYFDASPSQVYEDEITKYEWDFDGDNTYDYASTSPKTSHIYTTDFSGTAKVRLSTKSGLQSISEPAAITINSKAPVIARAPQNVKVTATSDSTAVLSWEPADNLAVSWAISLNDIYIGRLEGTQRSINISDLDLTQENTFGVRAITEDSQVGDVTFITLSPGKKEATSNALSQNNDEVNSEPTPSLDGSSSNTTPPDKSSTRSLSNPTWMVYAGIGALAVLTLAGLIALGIWLYRLKQKVTM